MIRNIQPQAIVDPTLLDNALWIATTQLLVSLPWLTYAFGRSEKIVTERDTKPLIVPAIYSSANEYIRLLPDEHLGSFSFFFIEKETVDFVHRSRPVIKANFRQVYWFDFRDVFTATDTEHEGKTLDHVKQLASQALHNVAYSGLSFDLTAFEVDPYTIYKGYSIDRLKDTYYMRPNGVFEISGTITYKTNC